MRRHQRKTAPRVRNGRVQRKNRWQQTPNYFTEAMPSLVIDRRRPGRGYRHLARKGDIRRFVKLLPEWEEISEGLNAIVLDSGNATLLGWHRPGVVAICAWETELEWEDCCPEFYREHRGVFAKLEIPVEQAEDGAIIVRFTHDTAKAFLLVHILVHEFGHHRDRMTTRSRKVAARGEGYAEAYARRHEDEVLRRYKTEFAA